MSLWDGWQKKRENDGKEKQQQQQSAVTVPLGGEVAVKKAQQRSGKVSELTVMDAVAPSPLPPSSSSGGDHGRHRRVVSFDSKLLAAPGRSGASEQQGSAAASNHSSEQTSLPSQRTNLTSAFVRKELAQPQDIESVPSREEDSVGITTTPKKRAVTHRDVVRIFVADDGDYTEVSREQLDRVRYMHDKMAKNTVFTFNYNTLLLVASILAGLGLVSNSTATIIASMLVSPLMGPVIGFAYGATIRDWKLCKTSMWTESISLMVCIAVGVVIAAITGPTALSDEWPTYEMASRAQISTFIVGLPIAFVSGLGVAVSVLDDQTSSLVGVAISASLLPPAVDCGIIWMSYAYMKADVLNLEVPEEYDYCDGNGTGDVGEEESLSNLVQKGLLSLFLTLANIVLIAISSMLMFRMKEVLPIEKNVFWEDLGVARKVYQRRAIISGSSRIESQSNDAHAVETLGDVFEVEKDGAPAGEP